RPGEFSEHGVQMGGQDLHSGSEVWIALISFLESAQARIALAGGINVSRNPCVPTPMAKGQQQRHSLDWQEARRFQKRACTCEMLLGRNEIRKDETSRERHLMCDP